MSNRRRLPGYYFRMGAGEEDEALVAASKRKTPCIHRVFTRLATSLYFLPFLPSLTHSILGSCRS